MHRDQHTIRMDVASHENGRESITADALIDILDQLERELAEQRRKHDALPTPAHIAARQLLEKLGRRNVTFMHNW